ncbi:MAG TPA: GatB/YqeY domain-containing protein [Thermoanaerobaculia bacterium]|nr:GatB/YqeY domain-containing protein [Thermoanaerobaculia bacterium]HUM28508.1 GatB/YqeY domain-containing protein [Thermoanaerobaculia bacterium]HXK66884.1 GatB/YqeY domain-containing protein [Thermoanaerobaculia bacterium]
MLDILQTHMKEAMKAREAERLSTIRMLIAALKNERIAKMADLDEDEIVAVLSRELKRRYEASEQFRKGGRVDMAEKEEREAEIIKRYLPQPLTDGELKEIVQLAIVETKAESMKEMGKVMKEVMGKVKGRADGKRVQEAVRTLLGG